MSPWAVAPTARSAAIVAGLALLALVVAPAVVVAGAAALLTAAAVDAWVVRRPPVIERSLPGSLSRGVASAFAAQARRRDGRATRLRQPALPAVTVEGTIGTDALTGTLRGRRRGRHDLPAVASASLGPLGLARVHHPAGDSVSVRVYPDLATAHALVGRLRRELARQPGRLSRGPLGLGSDFESVREYTPDDDIRQLNWRATARMGRPMSNQYRLERDRDLVCLVDTGRLMSAPIGSETMLDAALDAVVLLAMAADELGDRCGAIAFADRVRRTVAPGHLSGRRVIEALFDLEARAVDSDFASAFQRVGRARRALVAVFTDLVDEAAARSLVEAMPMLRRRHAVLVVSASDRSLDEVVGAAGTSVGALATALVADEVLQARHHAVATLRRAGASVIEAPADQLAGRCLDAYVRAKSRGQL